MSKFHGFIFNMGCLFSFFLIKIKVATKRKERNVHYIQCFIGFYQQVIILYQYPIPNYDIFFSFEILFCFQSDSGMILWTTSPPLPSMFYRINQPGEFSPCLINVQLALLFGMVRFQNISCQKNLDKLSVLMKKDIIVGLQRCNRKKGTC